MRLKNLFQKRISNNWLFLIPPVVLALVLFSPFFLKISSLKHIVNVFKETNKVKIINTAAVNEVSEMELILTPTPQKTAFSAPVNSESVFLDVSFTSQAPDGDWKNSTFQNGCEEASILMAMRWVNGETLTMADAIREITDISDFEQKNYGNFYDTSAEDTAKLMRDYFKYENVGIINGVTANIIKSELKKGNLIIAPMNGQILGNPFYTAPGPAEHMIVIIGYDPLKKEFITNDPGTRHGEKYRYNEFVFEAAIRDYPTGYHEPIPTVNKNIIIVRPLILLSE